MATVLQFSTVGSEQTTLVTQAGFDETTIGQIANVDSIVCYTVQVANAVGLFANAVGYKSNTFVSELYYGSPNEIRQPGFFNYTQTWLNQFFHYPIQGMLQGREGVQGGLILVLDRKVPGAGSDPGSGKIPQLEVPTKAAITGTGSDDSNAGSMVVPFPVQTIIG